MDHAIDGPPGTEATLETYEDLARLTMTTEVSPGNRCG